MEFLLYFTKQNIHLNIFFFQLARLFPLHHFLFLFLIYLFTLILLLFQIHSRLISQKWGFLNIIFINLDFFLNGLILRVVHGAVGVYFFVCREYVPLNIRLKKMALLPCHNILVIFISYYIRVNVIPRWWIVLNKF